MSNNLIEFRAGSFGDALAERRSDDDDFLDAAALGRVRSYQQEVERASALLCTLHPELIVSEVVPLREAETRRPRWPLILAICASGLFWMGIIWGLAHLA